MEQQRHQSHTNQDPQFQPGRDDRKEIEEKQRLAADRNLRPGEEGSLDVVEEQLEVGKRQVEKGGVRVTRTVEERPVEEQVNLREEHVHVDRRPVDRPMREGDAKAFEEGTIEVRETAEQPVVAKTARVVEEVAIRKDVDQRTETVRDTVRRSNVDVEQIGGTERSMGQQSGSMNTGRFEDFDSDFRQNFQQSQFGQQYQYEQIQPAYRYGYDLAGDNPEWDTIESDARTRWEGRNPGTWEKFKDSVRYAYNKARGKMS